MNLSSAIYSTPLNTNLSLGTTKTVPEPVTETLVIYLLLGVLLGILALYVAAEVRALKKDRQEREMVSDTGTAHDLLLLK